MRVSRKEASTISIWNRYVFLFQMLQQLRFKKWCDPVPATRITSVTEDDFAIGEVGSRIPMRSILELFAATEAVINDCIWIRTMRFSSAPSHANARICRGRVCGAPQ